MENISISNKIRTNRKVLTSQEEKKPEIKIIINKKSKSTPKNNISLSKKVLDSSTDNDTLKMGKKYKKNNFNLSEMFHLNILNFLLLEVGKNQII